MKPTQSPRFVGAMRAHKTYQLEKFNIKNDRRKFERSLFPTPASYYSKQFQKLKIKSEWVKVNCCFHNDSVPSLSINMVNGHFHCFGCGTKGGDVLSFHRLRYGLSFIEAVNHFGAWREER